jgi:ABC-type sugar transport system ATPase subunit
MAEEIRGTGPEDYILEFRHISKSFPGVKALSDITFGIKRGTVHVLVGENGAGKSTLFKIINGLYRADEGELLFEGVPIRLSGPSEALKAGISMIYQELNIVKEMTVLENMYLGREKPAKTPLFINTRGMLEEARSYLDQQGLRFNLNEKMKNLSVAEAQLLEITKAISVNARVILMDEPTSSLTEKEFKFLIRKIFELKKLGITIIYVSHKLEEIFQVGEYITVLRDGHVINTVPAEKTSIPEIIEMMVGRKMTEVYPPKQCETGETVFEVKNFNRKGVFRDINFTLRRGEILGVSGLIGAGRTEIARAVIGADPRDSGEVYLEGEPLTIRTCQDTIARGIVLIPEDRRGQGLSLIHSVADNIALVSYRHVFRSIWLKHRGIWELVKAMIGSLAIKTPSSETKVQSLSGGNQQKVVLGKWLSVKPKILILDEPTRGIDVGTKYEIYKLMHGMCKEGVSIILIDSDLEELMGMSDRVMVISGGRLAGIVEKKDIDAARIMHLAVGAKLEDRNNGK